MPVPGRSAGTLRPAPAASTAAGAVRVHHRAQPDRVVVRWSPTARSSSAWTSTTAKAARAAPTRSTYTTGAWCGSSTWRAASPAGRTRATTSGATTATTARRSSVSPPGSSPRAPGCDHSRAPNGCGNVWSSDGLSTPRAAGCFTASSNCDTDTNPATPRPDPPMPPYDEAIFALGLDGTPAWRWRPREVDNADLAFGAVPNLFTITWAACRATSSASATRTARTTSSIATA